MHKKLLFLLCALACAAGLCFRAEARVFVDDMNDISGNNIRRYNGLRMVEAAMAARLPDGTALTLANPKASGGQALYRVQNATLVRVSIITQNGTFITQKPNEPDKLVFGSYHENTGDVVKAPQAMFSRSTGGVYSSDGTMQAAFDKIGYVFTAAGQKPKDLCYYGVNISYSIDGSSYVACRPTRESVRIDSRAGVSFEDFAAAVPASAGYILVEINDFYSMPAIDGQLLQNSSRIFTCLAGVTLSGDSLLLGEPEPVVTAYSQEIEDISSESSAEGSSSASSQKAASSKAEPTSKFEGTIVSSSKSSSAGAKNSGASKSSRASSAESEPSELEESSAAEAEAIQPEPVVYEIPARSRTESRFTGGIIAYVTVVSAAAALLIAFGRKR